MESKHTPGPWVFEESYDIIWVGTPKQDSDGNCHIEEIILHINQDSEYKDSVKEKNRANATLIAAAPDLFDVVKEFYDWAIEHETYGRIFPKLEAAYKKATE